MKFRLRCATVLQTPRREDLAELQPKSYQWNFWEEIQWDLDIQVAEYHLENFTPFIDLSLNQMHA